MIKKLWDLLRKPGRYSTGALLLAGVVAGIIFWGGFHTALEVTNTLEFCTSCHEMSTVYEEYKKAPAVTRKRIYLEAMAQLLPKLGRKLVIDEKAKGILPLLQLDADRKEVKP